jgi:hypothetical protein
MQEVSTGPYLKPHVLVEDMKNPPEEETPSPDPRLPLSALWFPDRPHIYCYYRRASFQIRTQMTQIGPCPLEVTALAAQDLPNGVVPLDPPDGT